MRQRLFGFIAASMSWLALALIGVVAVDTPRGGFFDDDDVAGGGALLCSPTLLAILLSMAATLAATTLPSAYTHTHTHMWVPGTRDILLLLDNPRVIVMGR